MARQTRMSPAKKIFIGSLCGGIFGTTILALWGGIAGAFIGMCFGYASTLTNQSMRKTK